MPQTSNTFDWARFWTEKSTQLTDFQATGRSTVSQLGFLRTLRAVAMQLKLNAADRLLDVGCGTGLFSIAFADRVAEIVALDISAGMVERAQKNTQDIDNIEISLGSLPNIDGEDESFDKILVYSVLQYLPDESVVAAAFSEIARLLRVGGIAVFGCNPDPLKRAVYMDFLTLNTPPEDLPNSIALLERTLWISADRMIEIAADFGLSARAESIHSEIWQHFYMFDLVVEKR